MVSRSVFVRAVLLYEPMKLYFLAHYYYVVALLLFTVFLIFSCTISSSHANVSTEEERGEHELPP